MQTRYTDAIPLASRPNLEQYKTLAKDLLKDYDGLVRDMATGPTHDFGKICVPVEKPLPARGDIVSRDLPGGSFERLRDGIQWKLWPLPADTVVYPGHGRVTTIGVEKRTNPFVGDNA